MSYVPPHLRNKPQSSDSNMPPNPFVKKDRRPPRRPHEKSSWELQREQAERETEEKRKNAQRGLENNEENFPSLGLKKMATSAKWNITGPKFSEMASEWKNNDDERRDQEESQKDAVRKENKDVFVLPVFRSTKRFSDVDEKSPKDNEHEKSSESLDDGWTNVDNRKYRKPKAERRPEEEPMNQSKDEPEDDTVWDAPEEHETCWDDRRY